MEAEQTRQSGTARRRRSGGCGGQIVNLVTALLLLAAVGVLVFLGVALFAPGVLANTPLAGLSGGSSQPAEPTPTLVAVAALPTLTPTEPVPLLQATWTPLPTERSSEAETEVTPTPLAVTTTPFPTFTPSNTPFIPTRTPTGTPTNTPTNTPTATPLGPTATPQPTRSAFPFTKTDNSPFYLQNFANNARCDWMGIAGEVLDLNRNPVPAGGYRVHIWGSGIDERVTVGDAPAYSPSGWEQFLFNAPVVRDYNVQLETSNGTAVSQVYGVQTRASCNQNLVRVDFVQNH